MVHIIWLIHILGFPFYVWSSNKPHMVITKLCLAQLPLVGKSPQRVRPKYRMWADDDHAIRQQCDTSLHVYMYIYI